MLTTMKLSGVLVGYIWQPGVECWKELDYSITEQQARTFGKMTLRDHLLSATNDGDFRSCVIADGRLDIKRTWYRDGRHYSVSRSIPLTLFPSIADMLHPDPDWMPVYEFEDDYA
jgi:hypothetical protein